MTVPADGVAFATAFQRLRDYVDDDPAYLEKSWKSEPELVNLMGSVSGAYRSLELAEQWSSITFATNIPAEQIALRREYERRWKRIADEAENWKFMELFREFLPASDSPPERLSEFERRVRFHQDSAAHEADSLQIALDIAHDSYSDNDDDLEWLMPAERAWDTLRIACRLNVAEALWKRRVLPFTLIPTHVSDGEDESTRRSLHRLIDQAARSYIFGAPLACLALQRSIIEQVLRTQFKGRGATLDDVIESVRGRPLDDIFVARLDRIRCAANIALHKRDHTSVALAIDELVFDGFITLRSLIERAPRRG